MSSVTQPKKTRRSKKAKEKVTLKLPPFQPQEYSDFKTLWECYVEFPLMVHRHYLGTRAVFRNADLGFENPNGSDFRQEAIAYLYPQLPDNLVLDGILTVEYGNNPGRVENLDLYLRGESSAPPSGIRFIVYDLFDISEPNQPYQERLERMRNLFLGNTLGVTVPVVANLEARSFKPFIDLQPSNLGTPILVLREPEGIYTPGRINKGVALATVSFAEVEVVQVKAVNRGLAELAVTCRSGSKVFDVPYRPSPEESARILAQKAKYANLRATILYSGNSVLENPLLLDFV